MQHPHALSTGPTGAQFSVLNALDSLIPKDQNKNITTLRDESKKIKPTKNTTPTIFINGNKGMGQDTYIQTNRARRQQQEVNTIKIINVLEHPLGPLGL